MSEPLEIAELIKRKAFELGFSACGFTPVAPLFDLEPVFMKWLSLGNAGEMTYLERNVDVRLDPGKLVPGAKTIISLAAGYYAPLPPHQEGNPLISRYALGKDYHTVIKSLGKELLDWIQTEIGPASGRVFTDSAPVFEREWARRSGIGWIGKNGCLIIPRQGSWFFLAEIVLDLEIPSPDVPAANRCGTCTRCIEACPTGALSGNGSLDPRKCISYLTIEHRSEIPDEYQGKWKDWVFGCDICQDVCPWNREPVTTLIDDLKPRQGLTAIDRDFFIHPDESRYHQLFDGTPVERAGWSGILRNFEFLEKDEH